jgi:cbb3-type cytochrome oxidase maturation protein
MFYLGWILLTGVGVLVSIALFLWALRSGQFSDQERARYLALSHEPSLTDRVNSKKLSIEVYVLLALLGAGVLSLAAPLLLTVIRLKG